MVATPRIRIDRNELAGAFGDLGTSLPLLIGIMLASGAGHASVLIMFGLMQVFSALAYGVPVPAQPLKVVAAIVIAQQLDASIMYGAGLSIGVFMLFLTVTGLIDWTGSVVPKAVVRGIQLGLGLKLAALAVTRYAGADGFSGYVLAATGLVVTLPLLCQRRVPAALVLVGLGVVYSLIRHGAPDAIIHSWGMAVPHLRAPGLSSIIDGFVLLGLAQVPVSLGNSVLATCQVARDYYPDRNISIRKIGWTYSLMNLICPFFGGVPVCHGSGGMVGMHVFGGRTGGAVLIYGVLYVCVGLFFSAGFNAFLALFPLPILGVLLFIEAAALVGMTRDLAGDRVQLGLAALVGVTAYAVPYGFLIALVFGAILARFVPHLRLRSSNA